MTDTTEQGVGSSISQVEEASEKDSPLATNKPETDSTALSNKYVPLDKLRPHMSNCAVAVRIIRTWEINGKGGHTWEFIAVDSLGGQQHGKILMSSHSDFASLLAENRQISIADFQVCEDLSTSFAPLPQKSYIYLTKTTQVAPLSTDIVFPKYVFNFVPFTELHRRLPIRSFLADVIGIFARELESPGKKELLIYDAQKKSVRISFWDRKEPILTTTDLNPTEKNVVVVTSAQVKSYDGYINLNATKASKIYVNLDIPETIQLRQRFPPHTTPDPLSRVMDIKSGIKTLSYIRFMLDQQTKASYTCRAKIVEMYTSKGWHYISCNICKRKLRARYVPLAEMNSSSAIDWCEKCRRHITEPEPRLIIHFRIKDRSDESDITAFEDVVTEITGKTTDDFLDLQNHGGSEGVSNALSSLVGNEYHLHVRSGILEDANHQKTLTALAACLVCENPAKRQRITYA